MAGKSIDLGAKLFTVPLSSPDTGPLEEEFVLAALRSGWVAPAGPDLTAFEEEVAGRVGVEHAVGLSSGTAALHLALVSWGVGPGDVVPVSTFTFAATVNAIRYVGATPYFVDCLEETGNMNPALLEQALTGLKSEGASVPAIVPVDMLGKCVDYDAISAIAESAGARLLCDAAESFGATYRGRLAGAFGDASVISFNGNKIMTTSGGGMLLTNDGDLAAHVRKLSTQAREPVPHYEHTEIGYNYRLSNILAALGRAQLRRLDDMVKRRRQWRERYREALAGQPGVEILGGAADAEDNCWLTAILVDPALSPWSAGDLGAALGAAGIETRPVWKPMHLQPTCAGFAGSLDGSSERLFAHGLTLPSGSALADEAFDRVIAEIKEVTD
ncbi:DegT/DnrJ/EryC1/StrS family aminotransferase [Nocardioides massiliensis]|uniref:DegT/DnrJ/EryC1/StrS family aminotransferase n=1 Tax=Nocardioides massiliensis TaxID=1325935 RepID=UPI001C664901|nr:aminotransferase class I/II-fold pyridoxal phosphate-dependent enzyme [Nocardioides massiliensis]